MKHLSSAGVIDTRDAAQAKSLPSWKLHSSEVEYKQVTIIIITIIIIVIIIVIISDSVKRFREHKVG